MQSEVSALHEAIQMRGTDVQQGGLFSYVSLEGRIPAEHPLRGVRALLDEALASMSRDLSGYTRRAAGHRSRRNAWCGR